jgi:NAD(P)H-hydrate epimerase
VIPIVTPDQMAAIDAAATEPVDVLIDRAGRAVAREALRMLGGGYGRRVVVLEGRGNNGNDGRAATRHLRSRGVRVAEFDAASPPSTLPATDLVIDAAYGTGFRGTFHAPRIADPTTPVLAVDIPSGVSGLTGTASGEPWRADVTVTFAALKPGLLVGDGPVYAGRIVVADIGLDTSTAARSHLVEAPDVARWLPERPFDAHKWDEAVWVVAGSPGMTGAAHLCTRAAQRAGAGYVRLSTPGLPDDPGRPTEAVGHPLPEKEWSHELLGSLDRFRCLALGPGLGTSPDTARAVRSTVARARTALVVDGDGLTALGSDAAYALRDRPSDSPLAVLTPHEGEFSRLGGSLLPDEDEADEAESRADRFEAVRRVAAHTGGIMLLKGPTTLVAHPHGEVLAVTTGDERLATAGTGDVLTGIIAALLAGGAEPFAAAAAAAWIHGRAGALAFARGLVAGDLVDHLPLVFAELDDRVPPSP